MVRTILVLIGSFNRVVQMIADETMFRFLDVDFLFLEVC